MSELSPTHLTAPVASNASIRDYWLLLKPRVMSLSIFTGWVGMILAPGSLNIFLAMVAMLALALGAGGAAALNMWYDADIDAVMRRTASRPIPAGKIKPEDALIFGLVMSFLAVALMLLAANWLAAAILAFTIWFYAHIYTHFLKRHSEQNIVIGGLAGALPPLIGWTAATGSIAIEPVSLVALIFFWTPAHFWALALYKSSDYRLANIPMLPVTKGSVVTRFWVFFYALLTAIIGAVTAFYGEFGLVPKIGAVLLGSVLVLFAMLLVFSRAGNLEPGQSRQRWSLYHTGSQDKQARNMFAFSILYLFLIFALFAVDRFF